jgi:dUTP pyrophosphatase
MINKIISDSISYLENLPNWEARIDSFRKAMNSIMSGCLQVKRLVSDSVVPTKAYPGDAGYDLYSAEEVILKPGQITKISTGIALAIPEGYSGFIWDRSGNGSKGIKVFGGVIDSSYRGEVFVCLGLMNTFERSWITLPKGSKIAQLCLFRTPHFEILELDDETDLDKTTRGNKGFGSSG